MTKFEILDYLKKHYSEFKAKYEVREIGLFGSYARDEAQKDSDIDIFVTMKPTLSNHIDIKQELENAFQKKVDIVRIRENMNPFLQKRIEKEGIYAVR